MFPLSLSLNRNTQMAAATYTIAFNIISKTLTLTISDFDGMDPVNVWYRLSPDESYTDLGVVIPATQAITEFFYNPTVSPAITTTGAEAEVFPDGIYYLVVVDSGDDPNDVTYDSEVAMTTAEIRCCISSGISRLSKYEDDCVHEGNINKLCFMKLLLEGAEYDATSDCGDYEEAQRKLDYIKELCGADDECLKRDC